jgi:hypothetical protein
VLRDYYQKHKTIPQSCQMAVISIPRMEISNEYKSRHGFADFEYNLFQITSGENIVQTCKLIKVHEYTYTNTYVEKICEGNGWYSNGAKITEQITHDFYWLVVLNDKCLGVINENAKSKSSSKYAIQDLNGKKYVKSFLATI